MLLATHCDGSGHQKGLAMQELVMMGFTERHRASEVLPQLQRLTFDWSTDLRNAVAVEIERDGRLRLHQSQLLDPAVTPEMLSWKAILSAIVPLPHTPSSSRAETLAEVRAINEETGRWLKAISSDRDFARNAAALLCPGNSAIFAIVGQAQSALAFLGGYSHFVLHTAVTCLETDLERT
jgi:uncharacterized membrane protein